MYSLKFKCDIDICFFWYPLDIFEKDNFCEEICISINQINGFILQNDKLLV